MSGVFNTNLSRLAEAARSVVNHIEGAASSIQQRINSIFQRQQVLQVQEQTPASLSATYAENDLTTFDLDTQFDEISSIFGEEGLDDLQTEFDVPFDPLSDTLESILEPSDTYAENEVTFEEEAEEFEYFSNPHEGG